MKKETEFRKRAAEIVAAMTREEKLRLLTTHQFAVERLGLPEFYIGTEVARGFVGRRETDYSTVTPQPIGMAASFDRDLIRQIGSIAGDECRAYHNSGDLGGLCVWGPTVDMERDPRWGRTEEAYGEDVLLAGEMSAAYTQGLAGSDDTYMKTVPTLKHFCANNHEETRTDENSVLPLRLKYEYYYAAFMPAVRYGGARSVMTAYNEINGLPALLNPELNSILKKQWGLWFAVTDGADFQQTVLAHHWCATHAEALAEAVKAGCNIMTDEADLTRRAAETALQNGLLTEADIDRSLAEVIYARLRLGQMDADCPYHAIGKETVDSDAARAVNLQMAKEQIVLLKNDGLLPLKPEHAPQTIAVVGPLADENLMDWYTGIFRDAVSPLEGIRAAYPQQTVRTDSLWDLVAVKTPNGKYLAAHPDGSITADADTVTEDATFELQDWGENWVNLYSPKYKRYVRRTDDGFLCLHSRRIYDWFTQETFNLFSAENGTLIEDYRDHRRLMLDSDGTLHFTERRTVLPDCLFTIETVSSGEERAQQLARKAGVVIYCTGNHPVQVAKECHDRRTLALNIQPDMACRLHEANAKTVLLLISSYPYAICREQETLPAIVWSSHAGAHLGTACAAVLSGSYNPTGRLPMTWYRSEHELPSISNYDIAEAGTTYMYFRGTPLYPFGYGCSYSAFSYRDIRIVRGEDGRLTAEVTVQNTSDTDGDEVVQVYSDKPESAVSRPLKKLCGFARVHLRAGETKLVSAEIPAYILQIYDTHSGRMLTEAGTYRFYAGSSSAVLPVQTSCDIAGETIGLRGHEIAAEAYDAAHSVDIRYSRAARCHYLRTCGWNGTAVYHDVPLAGAKSLRLSVVSPIKECTVHVKACGHELAVTVYPCGGPDDFQDYTVQLPDGLPDSGTVVIILPEAVQLSKITVET